MTRIERSEVLTILAKGVITGWGTGSIPWNEAQRAILYICEQLKQGVTGAENGSVFREVNAEETERQ